LLFSSFQKIIASQTTENDVENKSDYSSSYVCHLKADAQIEEIVSIKKEKEKNRDLVPVFFKHLQRPGPDPGF
jgi:hypothetical protein